MSNSQTNSAHEFVDYDNVNESPTDENAGGRNPEIRYYDPSDPAFSQIDRGNITNPSVTVGENVFEKYPAIFYIPREPVKPKTDPAWRAGTMVLGTQPYQFLSPNPVRKRLLVWGLAANTHAVYLSPSANGTFGPGAPVVQIDPVTAGIAPQPLEFTHTGGMFGMSPAGAGSISFYEESYTA